MIKTACCAALLGLLATPVAAQQIYIRWSTSHPCRSWTPGNATRFRRPKKRVAGPLALSGQVVHAREEVEEMTDRSVPLQQLVATYLADADRRLRSEMQE